MSNTISLNGKWRLSQLAGERRLKKSVEALVPGDVYQALLTASVIEDPFYRDREDSLKWIGYADWRFARSFSVPAALLKNDKIFLRCEGLDTLADISINGKRVAKTDNMFRIWEFDVAKFLVTGSNTITVDFLSARKYIDERVAHEGPIRSWGGPKEVKNRAWIRKQPCDFGWDWGPVMVTAGIWRSLSLVGSSTAVIDDVQLIQKHERGAVSLTSKIVTKRVGKNSGVLTFSVKVKFEGKVIAEKTTAVRKSAEVVLNIPDPQLWWPNGLGAQPLYTVEVVLLDADGNHLDSTSRRIGLRTLSLDRHDDEWGESFQFVVNGIPFFAKGANWIPADAVVARIKPEDYRRLIGDARAVNMNMLRVWGGGFYENDAFYDACDEAGICVWQDFMFACSNYPLQDKKFLDSIRHEAEDNVRRIRHHAALALWCGNNELECGFAGTRPDQMSWELYGAVFDKMLPEVLEKLNPGASYWPGSPHTPRGDRADSGNPASGDAHLWAVWHGREPFEWYRTCQHRFNSEFGFQSFPEPRTIDAFTLPEDRNITSPVMEHHQRSGIGNAAIMGYMLDWFRMPSSFNMLLSLSQVLQGVALKYACEHWRRQMPRGMGTLYWQLNDCWPVASWSSIDYFGRWKAAHYLARKFFAPILVSCLENTTTNRVDLHVTSDLGEAKLGTITWFVYTAEGSKIAQGDVEGVVTPVRGNVVAATLDLSEIIAKRPDGARGIILVVELAIQGQIVSDNLAMFVRPKTLDLRKPSFCYEVAKSGKHQFTIAIHTDKPALWAWLDLGEYEVKCSDNYFHIMPNRPAVVTITDPVGKLTAAKVASTLTVKSLFDTYQESAPTCY